MVFKKTLEQILTELVVSVLYELLLARSPSVGCSVMISIGGKITRAVSFEENPESDFDRVGLLSNNYQCTGVNQTPFWSRVMSDRISM